MQHTYTRAVRFVNFVGGVNPTAVGNIHPIDARPITIQNYSGYVNTIYKSGVPASDTGKGQIIVEHAADNSHITMQGDHSGNTIDDASYKKDIQALAENCNTQAMIRSLAQQFKLMKASLHLVLLQT